jgi:hypothetical protein
MAPQGLPHDVRGLVPYETPWYIYAGWVLAGVLICLLVIWAIKWFERYRERKNAIKPPIDPWVDVKERIQSLTPDAQFEPKAQIEFYYELSMLLRECIELRTKIRATDLTYQELKKPLESKLPLKTDGVSGVLAFLERADLIKFAEQPATLAEATAAKAQVSRWASMLTPRQDEIQQITSTPITQEGSLS